MKRSSRMIAVAAAAAISGLVSSANGALVLRYDSPAAFATGSTVPALVGPNGTAIAAITNAADTSGTGRTNNYGITNDPGGAANSGWNTGVAFNTLTAANGTFTAFAVVNPLDNAGDNMVFGTSGGSPLHLGIRNDTAHFGMWGNDSNGAAGSAPAPNTTAVMAWRFSVDPVNVGMFVQDIFVNGANVSSSPNHGAFGDAGSNLLIGTANGNGGDFNGGIDDIRLYNTVETDASVATISAAMNSADLVPEPASLGLLGLGALGLLARRRRA